MDKVNLCMHRYEYLAETEKRLDDLYGFEVYQKMIAVQCPYCYAQTRMTVEQWEKYKKNRKYANDKIEGSTKNEN